MSLLTISVRPAFRLNTKGFCCFTTKKRSEFCDVAGSPRMTRLGSWRCRFIVFLSYSLFPIQQTLPVDLSSSSVRSGGNGGASFHGSTSAFDPCCPGSASRPPPYVSQAIPGPSQPAVVDSFGSTVVAQPQPQTQPQPCRHYMHPSCECYGYMQNSNGAFSHFLLCVSKALMVFLTLFRHPQMALWHAPCITSPRLLVLILMGTPSFHLSPQHRAITSFPTL